jgi:GMP synthase PP-ATPase subunit
MTWEELHGIQTITPEIKETLTEEQQMALTLASKMDRTTAAILLSDALNKQTPEEAIDALNEFSCPSKVAEKLAQTFDLKELTTIACCMVFDDERYN